MYICILTKALPLFIILLNIAYVELMVGEIEACTCDTYIANLNIGSREMTYHTNWSRSCMCVDSGWWQWNTPFMKLSLLYLEVMRTWLYIFYLDIHVSNFFHLDLHGSSLFFIFSILLERPCLICRSTRERDHSLEFYCVDGCNGIANFQWRSLACGVYVISIKQIWKTSH